MLEQTEGVIYWDASAVLSVLIHDAHSRRATGVARRPITHLISTLAYAEVIAVLSRLEREGELASVSARAARQFLRRGRWRGLMLQPDWSLIVELASRWPLRGADLWHLATASTLKRELPELRLITFDSRLRAAAEGLGLAL